MSGEMMLFPSTVEEFMEQYKVVDRDHILSNGAEFVPLFRMKQWFDHLQAQPITNADRVRGMTDEELAVWMVQWTDCYECVARTRGCCQSDESCASSICNWLKQEVET